MNENNNVSQILGTERNSKAHKVLGMLGILYSVIYTLYELYKATNSKKQEIEKIAEEIDINPQVDVDKNTNPFGWVTAKREAARRKNHKARATRKQALQLNEKADGLDSRAEWDLDEANAYWDSLTNADEIRAVYNKLEGIELQMILSSLTKTDSIGILVEPEMLKKIREALNGMDLDVEEKLSEQFNKNATKMQPNNETLTS